MDRKCRICRTTSDLKFSKKQLLEEQKERRKLELLKNRKIPMALGNICMKCDKALDQGFEFSDDELNVDDSDLGSGNSNNSSNLTSILNKSNSDLSKPQIQHNSSSMATLGNLNGADDLQQWLVNCNIMSKNNNNNNATNTMQITQKSQQQSSTRNTYISSLYAANHSLGSDGDTEIVEVLTSRESSPGSIDESLPIVPIVKAGNYGQTNIPANMASLDAFVAPQNLSNMTLPSQLTTSLDATTPVIKVLETIDLSLDDEDDNQTEQSSLIHSAHDVVKDTQNFSITPTNVCETSRQNVEYSGGSGSASGRKRRKIYNEKEQRLVGSFNLVSSDNDSEAELPPLTHFTPPSDCRRMQAENTNLELTPKHSHGIDMQLPVLAVEHRENIVSPQSNISPINSKADRGKYQCDQCVVNFTDAEVLADHQHVQHDMIRCKLCSQCLTTNLRLVSHMRHKHRNCVRDDILCEQRRNLHDSAMTIRLRYLEKFNYYECQICGHIDEVFKEHTTHIKQQHANESKMLKDPMSSPSFRMLKCCVCKFRSNKQHIELVRHLVETHEYWEYRKQLKIANKVYDVQKDAVAYELQHAKKKYFFKCKRCFKVVSGFPNHRKHQAIHKRQKQQQQEEEEKKAREEEIEMEIQKQLDIISNKPLQSRNDYKKQIEQQYTRESSEAAKPKQQVQNKTKVETRKYNTSENKSQQNNKLPIRLRLNNNDRISRKESIKKRLRVLKGSKTNHKNTKLNSKNVKKAVVEKKNIFQKPEIVGLTTKNIAGNHVNYSTTKEISASKRKRRQVKSKQIAQIVKVKVKQPIRQFPTKRYTCNLCHEVFKGFTKLNLHKLLNKCKTIEFPQCSECKDLFFNSENLVKHLLNNCRNTISDRRRLGRKNHLEKACIKSLDTVSDCGDDVIIIVDDEDEELQINKKSFNEHNKRKHSVTPNEPTPDVLTKRLKTDTDSQEFCASDANTIEKNDLLEKEVPILSPIDWLTELIQMAKKRGRIETNNIDTSNYNIKVAQNTTAIEGTDHQNLLSLTNKRLASEASLLLTSKIIATNICCYCGNLFPKNEYCLYCQQHEEQQQKQHSDTGEYVPSLKRIIRAIPLT